MEISPSTEITRATMASGIWREKMATDTVQIANNSSHSSKEPSCPPQTAAKRYIVGKRVLEFSAT